MQARALLGAAFVFENHNIIAIARSWPKANDRFGGNPFLANHLVEHLLRVLEQRGGRLADHCIGQNGWIAAMQIPALEKRRPIDIVAQFRQIIIVKHFQASKLRLDRLIALRGRKGIGAGIGKGAAFLLPAAARMRLRHRLIIGANFCLIIGLFIV